MYLSKPITAVNLLQLLIRLEETFLFSNNAVLNVEKTLINTQVFFFLI